MNVTGWLFDYHAVGNEMVLWFITDDGERLRLVETFEPLAFAEGPEDEVLACARAMEKARDAAGEGWTERRDFWTGAPRRVFAFRLLHIETWRSALNRYADKFPALSWYNADLLAEQTYGFERDVFPLMRCRVEHEDGRLLTLAIEEGESRWLTGYSTPPFRMAELHGEGTLRKRHASLRSLTMECEGRTLTWDDPREMLPGLQRALDDLDPDMLLTDGGDAFLMPLLYTLAKRTKFPLKLDRDLPPPREVRTDGRSYFSYGRILYQAPEYPLRGRWHLDRRNSFSLSHNGMDGLFEVARLSRIPMQHIARRSIGTGISSIQLDLAWREGFLIPWKKTQPEAWKSARQLLKADRGGIVYAPETGFHENVVELDFVAMYPSIMSRYNVSPETVNCACCDNGKVPQVDYTICEKRDGLVSRALAPIIAKRVEYKRLRKLAKETGDAVAYGRWNARQDALKWMLVCCFGYLGYRNARFGRIEAHEAVSAYSREMLMRAREVCEEHGWHMLHANVDCVWIVKPGFRDEEIAPLRDAVTQATNLPIALEGIYKWLAFLPSRQNPEMPVPTRYFGAFRDGSVKYRGIECRRHDLPIYVKNAQLELLRELAKAPDKAFYRAMVPTLLDRIAEMEGAMWRHEVPLEELVIRQSLSKDPGEYTGNGAQSIAARQSVEAAMGLHAGESLSYIITSSDDPDRSRRVRLKSLVDHETTADPIANIRLLRRAMNTLLWPGGVQLDEKNILPPWAPPTRRKPAKSAQTGSIQPDLFGSAF
ncbi:MAG: polymerase [Candidatus Sumerlaeota bacterium]|nr:polymerase [Candidatus Sumerlaeota bacterium]